MNQITLGPVTLSGDTAKSGEYLFTKLVDWYSLPDSKSPIQQRPQLDGAFSFPDYRESASITVSGTGFGASPADCVAMQKSLTAARSGQSLIPMKVEVSGDVSTRMVSVRSINIDDHRGRDYFNFQIAVVAPDPHRYGETAYVSTGLASSGTGIRFPVLFPVSFGAPGASGRATAVNGGSADTWSTFTVGGGGLWGGFTLVHVESGRQVRVDRDVPMGSVVSLDSRTGTALIDGSPIPGSLTRSEWWPVPAGSSASVQFLANGAVSGTPTLTVATAPASL
jgi:hypothetical protein